MSEQPLLPPSPPPPSPPPPSIAAVVTNPPLAAADLSTSRSDAPAATQPTTQIKSSSRPREAKPGSLLYSFVVAPMRMAALVVSLTAVGLAVKSRLGKNEERRPNGERDIGALGYVTYGYCIVLNIAPFTLARTRRAWHAPVTLGLMFGDLVALILIALVVDSTTWHREITSKDSSEDWPPPGDPARGAALILLIILAILHSVLIALPVA